MAEQWIEVNILIALNQTGHLLAFKALTIQARL